MENEEKAELAKHKEIVTTAKDEAIKCSNDIRGQKHCGSQVNLNGIAKTRLRPLEAKSTRPAIKLARETSLASKLEEEL